MASVEQKHLKGLVFRTSKIGKGDDGKKKNFPVERPLELGDLLSQSDQDDSFKVVTKDGKKYVVPKKTQEDGDKEKEAGKEKGAGKEPKK